MGVQGKVERRSEIGQEEMTHVHDVRTSGGGGGLQGTQNNTDREQN